MSDRIWLDEVMEELARARAKFPAINSLHEGYAVILEELDEFFEEVRSKQRTSENLSSELVQVAAMCVRTLTDVVDPLIVNEASDAVSPEADRLMLIHWPGQSVVVCPAHRNQINRLAVAIGMPKPTATEVPPGAVCVNCERAPIDMDFV